MGTLAQLRDKQSALKQSQMKCEASQGQLQKQLAERDWSQQELSQKAESIRKKLSEKEGTWENSRESSREKKKGLPEEAL